MRKFENVDLLDCLEKIMNIHTQYYKSDFEYDRRAIQTSANSSVEEDKHLLWLSRSHGTHCLFEKDVFIKGTPSNNTFKYWNNEKNIPIAYALSIQKQTDGKIIGNLYQLDYKDTVALVKRNTVKADNQVLHYENGDKIMDFGKWFSPDDHKVYGKFISLDYLPNEPEQLNDILKEVRKKREHYTVGDINEHIADLSKKMIKSKLAIMTEDEKEDIISHVELCRDFGKTDLLAQADVDLYNAITAERAKKPSIRRQLAKNKATSEPIKPKIQKKEVISL